MLSVVIPTLNAQDNLAALLTQVRGRADEIVVSDGGSTDQTLTIAAKSGVRIALGCKGRGWQLARGAGFASGDWLLFLHADVTLAGNWYEAVTRHMERHPKKAAHFRFRANAKGFAPRLVDHLIWWRTLFSWQPYGDQGMLIPRALYEQVGGYPDWMLFEDMQIVKAIRGHAWLWPQTRLRKLSAPIYINMEKYQTDGYWKRGLRNLGLAIKFLRGADPQDLANSYQ